MSPRTPSRRPVVLAAVAFVTVLALGTAAGWVVLRGGGVAGVPGAAPAGVPQDRPGPVLVVPGYGGSEGSVGVLVRRLRAAGRSVTVLRLPGDGTGSLEEQARVLAARAAAVRGAAPSVDVVGFSAGGVVARLWARSFGGAAVARRVVTLGAPHHGSRVAALAAGFFGASCPPACRQLVPDSPLLTALNAGDETPDGPRWVSVWTDDDEIVTPPATARLAGAVDVRLQAVCPGVRVPHARLPADPLPVGVVLRALDVAEPAPVGPADCGPLRRAGAA